MHWKLKKSIGNESNAKKYSERIIHVSVDEGDGAGYDIQSFDYDAATGDVIEYYIEVKSTTGGIDTPFIYLRMSYKSREKKESSIQYTEYLRMLKISGITMY